MESFVVDRREFRFEFPCPRCQARLRLQNRALIGTRWNCPECQTPIEIHDTGHGDLVARIAVEVSNNAPPPARRGLSPQTAASLVAITLITGVAVFVLWTPTSQPPTVVKPAEETLPHPTQISLPAPLPPQPVDPVERQLTALGDWLNGHREKSGAFPAAHTGGDLADSEPLSWLSLYRQETEPQETVHPSVTHGWQDPANEPFVRRRAPSLLNPRIPAIASEEGYPVSHYVGVSGVGTDAANLPKTHPRAGVFGTTRRTSLEDITDGTSNTLLVAGVESQPPAWAHGSGSIRSFTAEPYFGGPDHFGTGDPEGMHVLMADGSVRFLSKQTDSKLIRRMAAMADGIPLDTNVPDEPADPMVPEVIPPENPALPLANAPAAAEPIAVEVTPETAGYDVEKGLAISIKTYQIKAPVPLRTVLREMVEMSALPIDATAITDSARLDQLVSLDLQNTTLRAILTSALDQAQLTFTADARGIHLQMSEPRPPVDE